MSETVSPPTVEDLENRITEQLIPLGASIKFDGQDWNDIIPATLYCATIETAWACIHQIRAGLPMQANQLLRSLLEIWVDFIRTSTSEQNVLDFRRRAIESRLDQLRTAKQGNPFLSKIAQMPDLDEVIENFEEERTGLIEAGGESQSIYRRFCSIGAEAEYKGLYSALSNDVHGDLNALIARFMNVNEEGVEFRAFHIPSAQESDAIRLTLSEVLDRTEMELRKRFL